MSRILRRLYSTAKGTPGTSTPSAQEIATQFLQRYTSQPAQSHTQLLDSNQLARLSATLYSFPSSSQSPTASPSLTPPTTPSSPAGTPLPPCHHLAYFTPSQPSQTLSPDGTDNTYNPSPPFTRRMWAGGSVHWHAPNPLLTGQTVTETTQVLSAAAKKTKAGEEMVVVGVEKTFSNEFGVAVTDRRSWIFREEVSRETAMGKVVGERPAVVDFPAMKEGERCRDLEMSAVDLFRFSALTFNAHKIHYNREWCREVEGHRDLVVHGPLNLVFMVDFWRAVLGKGEGGGGILFPKSITYRATHPVYAGEKYRIYLAPESGEGEKVSEVRIVDSFGNVCMKGTITR